MVEIDLIKAKIRDGQLCESTLEFVKLSNGTIHQVTENAVTVPLR